MLAYIADGKLFLCRDNGPSEELQSPFIRRIQDDDRRDRELNAWKSQPRDAGPMGVDPFPLWGMKSRGSGPSPCRFTHLARGADGVLFYVIQSAGVTGLFRYDVQTGEERRLFHRNEYFLLGVAFSEVRREFVVSVRNKDASVSLDLLDEEGNYLKGITEGDSLDLHPHFSLQNPDEIVFSSAGIGRNAEGHVLALAPAALMKLNLESGDLAEIQTSPTEDFLLPRIDAKGRLYFIRRPHQALHHRSLGADALNALLFLPRLIGAFFGFLNLFIELFNRRKRKPIGLPAPEADTKLLNVLGETIDCARIRKDKSGEYSLVPESWRLLRVASAAPSAAAPPEVLDRSVCSYDLAPGELVVTNGSVVRGLEGPARALRHRADLVEAVVIV